MAASASGGSRAKYSYLLADEDVNRWYRNVARGSRITADVCLRRLGAYCAEFGVTPRRLVEFGDKELTRHVLEAVGKLEDRGFAGSYISSTLKALKSWLRFNGVIINVKIKIAGAYDTPTLENERTPTPEELGRIFRASKPIGRCLSSLVSFAGVRLETIGNYDGTDGLKIGDFAEVEIDNERKTAVFTAIPARIYVRKSISKTRKKYLTYLCEEGCRILKEHWEQRMREGEVLTSDSPAVRTKRLQNKFLRTTRISDMIRAGIRAAGFPWRPYVLRCYFETQMMVAESKGLVIRDYRTHWMGHKGDIDNLYSTNKGDLPPHVIQDMREAYRRAQKYLQTEALDQSGDLKLEFRRQLLLAVGYRQEEIDAMDLEKTSDEELHAKLRMKLLNNNGNSCVVNGGRGQRKVRQRLVSIDEVESYIEQGWLFKQELSNGRVVMESFEEETA